MAIYYIAQFCERDRCVKMGLAASKQEAFWEACGFGNPEAVKMFLTDGIDVNWKSHVVSSGGYFILFCFLHMMGS